MSTGEPSVADAPQLAAVIPDPLDPTRGVHPLPEILLARILAIACGYERRRRSRQPAGLANAVDLIVMATVRKAEELLLERGEPRRLRGEEDLPGFDAGRGDRHSAHLVALGLDWLYVEAALPQLSDQRR